MVGKNFIKIFLCTMLFSKFICAENEQKFSWFNPELQEKILQEKQNETLQEGSENNKEVLEQDEFEKLDELQKDSQELKINLKENLKEKIKNSFKKMNENKEIILIVGGLFVTASLLGYLFYDRHVSEKERNKILDDLKKNVEELKSENTDLKNKSAELKRRVDPIENRIQRPPASPAGESGSELKLQADGLRIDVDALKINVTKLEKDILKKANRWF